MTSPDPLDLEAATARLETITPGSWHRSGSTWIDAGDYDEVIAPAPVECMAHCYGGSSRIELSDADAEFIAHAPDDMRALLGAVKAVRALHRPREYFPSPMSRFVESQCAHCGGDDWPCPTEQALAAALGAVGDPTEPAEEPCKGCGHYHEDVLCLSVNRHLDCDCPGSGAVGDPQNLNEEGE